jgi:hypothetical protein
LILTNILGVRSFGLSTSSSQINAILVLQKLGIGGGGCIHLSKNWRSTPTNQSLNWG